MSASKQLQELWENDIKFVDDQQWRRLSPGELDVFKSSSFENGGFLKTISNIWVKTANLVTDHTPSL